MIKLIAFDFWGTLAIKGNPFFDFTNTIREQFQIKTSKEEIRDVYEKIVQTKYWETEIDAYTEFAKKIKISPTKDNVLKLLSIRDKSQSDIIVFDFVIPLFKKLKKNGYQIAIVSNSSMFSYNEIKKRTNVLDYVDYEFFSFKIGYTKPNPQMFLELQRKVQVFNNEVLMIGDDFENDFKAPKKLGINAILFRNYDDLLEKFKEYKINL